MEIKENKFLIPNAESAFFQQSVKAMTVNIFHFKSEDFSQRRRFIHDAGAINDSTLFKCRAAGEKCRPMIAPRQTAVRSRCGFVITRRGWREQRCGRIIAKGQRLIAFDDEIKRSVKVKLRFGFFFGKDVSQPVFPAFFGVKQKTIYALTQRRVIRIAQLNPAGSSRRT